MIVNMVKMILLGKNYTVWKLQNSLSENCTVISKKLSHRDADRILRMEKWQNAQKMVAPLLDLEILKISSACSERTLTFLLYQCLNVKEIYMGMTTCVSDQVFSDVLTKNSLSRLERLKIQKCSKVSNFTFSQICTQCVNWGNYSNITVLQKLREINVFNTLAGFTKYFSSESKCLVFLHCVFQSSFCGIKILKFPHSVFP